MDYSKEQQLTLHIERLQKTVNQLTEENKQLKSKVVDRETEILSLQNNNDNLEREVSKLSSDLEELEEEIDTLESDNDTLEFRLEEAEGEVELCKEDLHGNSLDEQMKLEVFNEHCKGDKMTSWKFEEMINNYKQ